jgi:hypothetical protein
MLITGGLLVAAINEAQREIPIFLFPRSLYWPSEQEGTKRIAFFSTGNGIWKGYERIMLREAIR